MSDKGSNETPSTWAGPSTSRPALRRDASTITIRGFEVPQSPQTARTTAPAPLPPTSRPHDPFGPSEQHLRPRRSSLAERIGSLGDVGGPNSINNFTSSFQRAAAFHDITHRPSLRLASINASDAEHDVHQRLSDAEQGPSILGPSLQRGRESSETAVLDDTHDIIATSPDVGARIAAHRRLSAIQAESIFNNEPHFGASLGASYDTTYGALSSRLNEPAKKQADRLFSEQQDEVASASAPDKEREPLLTKRVHSEGGQSISVVVGQSTLYQTIFNSVNVLIGVGMLSLPLGIKFSGWLIGMLFFALSAITTSYTAGLLAKCIDVDSSLVTFADVAYISYGHRARIYISIIFTLELLAACVALVILFADSVDLLIPGWGVTEWKVVCGVILVPLGFLPMRFLGFTSILGILSCVIIVIAVFVDGILKPSGIGSLHHPQPTYLFPKDWRTLGLGFGLMMAPWGGHSVFPNIYRDMRHPRKYKKAMRVTYIFTYLLESALAIAGYLMFGDGVRDEITANIFLTKGYPRVLSIIIVVAIAIIPLSKIPLNARPIISTIELFLGIDPRASTLSGLSPLTRGIIGLTIRILVPVALVVIAIAVPSFDRVMSLLGSLACFSICVVLPCSFHLKIFAKDLSMRQKALDWTLIVVCSALAVFGTVSSILPKKMLGAE